MDINEVVTQDVNFGAIRCKKCGQEVMSAKDFSIINTTKTMILEKIKEHECGQK